jgi:hypothetical protein
MPVSYILKQVGAKAGLNPSATSQRTVMLRWLNEASRELYRQSNPPGSLMEQAFKVNGDQTISLPWYVGPIQAIREVDSQITWSINRMRPRYNQFNWPDSWRNIRLRNVQALMCTITNQSVITINTPAIETIPPVVTVTGSTLTGSNVSESLTVNSLTVQTVNQFLDITSVKKNIINAYDITISDVDGNTLSVLPNCQLQAQYQIVDVSICPWLAVSTNTLEHYVEILYKKANYHLWNDTDEFVFGNDYDDILVNKCIQLWYEEQAKADLSQAFDQKATRTLARKNADQNRATEDEIAVVAHPHDVILPRVRTGRKKYYRGYGSRGYGF